MPDELGRVDSEATSAQIIEAFEDLAASQLSTWAQIRRAIPNRAELVDAMGVPTSDRVARRRVLARVRRWDRKGGGPDPEFLGWARRAAVRRWLEQLPRKVVTIVFRGGIRVSQVSEPYRETPPVAVRLKKKTVNALLRGDGGPLVEQWRAAYRIPYATTWTFPIVEMSVERGGKGAWYGPEVRGTSAR